MNMRARAAAAAVGMVLAASATGVAQADDKPQYPPVTKTVTCAASTNSAQSVLKVKVAPSRKGSKYYTFRVQKLTKSGWKSVKVYRTKGKSETRSVNLRKGTYRVVCKGAGSYKGAVSNSAALRR